MKSALLMKLKRYLPADSRGQSAVEFAIVLPVFLLLLLNFIEWGFVLWTQITFENAVRDGARSAAVITDWNTNYARRSAEISAIVQDRVSSLPAGQRVNISSRISTEIRTDSSQNLSVRVSIMGQPYKSVTGFPGAILPGSLTARAEFRCEGGT